MNDIVKELADFIDQNSPFSDVLHNPETLVGRRIIHKFEVDSELGETKWYSGIIVRYNASAKTHEINYDEEEHCFFDITIDVINGDLQVLD